jgi:drug/metabolite transporter (DMT)-like permease
MHSVHRKPGRATGIVAALVTIGIWTAFIVIARASAKGSLSPFDLALVRIVGASLVLVPVGWWMARRDAAHASAQEGPGHASSFWGLSPLSWRLTVVCGVFGGLAYGVLAYIGFFFAPAAHASVLMPGSLPLWTTLLATVLISLPITRARWIGLACIVGGDLLVGGASLLHALDGGDVWKGDLLFMSAAFCWSVYSVLARRFVLDAVRATSAITVFALFSYGPIYVLGRWLDLIPSHLSAASWSEILFQGAFQGIGSVVISGVAFVRMIETFGPVRSTMLTAVVPGLSALGAAWWLAEPLPANVLIGLALVTVGIVFGVRKVK